MQARAPSACLNSVSGPLDAPTFTALVPGALFILKVRNLSQKAAV